MIIHLIAIGGSIMHNLAMELQALGHRVTGSDDEIYEPALSRLSASGLLPQQMGWDASRVSEDIDLIILGMHAQLDNPELQKAQELGLRIESFPEYIADHIATKKKIVVTGSHGKTSTTAMIMYALNKLGISFDYLVGGLIDGFDRMVRLSDDAKVAVVEGDEYLSSRLDDRPKMLHYKGDVVITTGVAWDHMNVFPTYDSYLTQFRKLYQSMDDDAIVIYDQRDEELVQLMKSAPIFQKYGYDPLEHCTEGIVYQGQEYATGVFGAHNRANLHAAMLACVQIGVEPKDFLTAIADFTGVDKRLTLVSDDPIIYRDFAHAPSKVKATVSAVRERYAHSKILAVLELHTYSSLNAEFIPQYAGALEAADRVLVFYDPKVVDLKRLPPVSVGFIADSFAHSNLTVVDRVEDLKSILQQLRGQHEINLLMSSGNFGNIKPEELIKN
jgi:UDP-N-acetylmuramate: L-alanyl-gamma-D-glutamyl-meso-diaminopimelate ligase